MEQLALKLRREWGIDNYAPIDIFSLALEKIENLTLKWYEMDGIVSGCCLRSEDDNLILINSRHSKGRQNFTLAHELYHLNFDESSNEPIFEYTVINASCIISIASASFFTNCKVKENPIG